MKTHSQTIFCDDFVAQRQIEEYEHLYPEIAYKEELVVWSSGSRILRAFQVTLRLCFAPCVFVARSLLRLVKLIRWASTPQKQYAPKKVHPGVVLEFVVFGLLVVSAAMSTLF